MSKLAPSTQLQTFLSMVDSTGVGYGTRIDYDPPGTAIQIEQELINRDDGDEIYVIQEFWFDNDGVLQTIHCYQGE